ncbi:hypothetical protein IWC96_08565 [Brevundimonas sp. BAL450]|uniref:hypothetical protein n=1 Tax=Brevundimonas sp. BAL450 TaxID=1708162 RepID=UPI0018CBD834|nr:hypothetical protein [Brevundimonas sp. BAL450]MBG7615334.1 hypothetical protein [Brevundimonas sp. BAL450]
MDAEARGAALAAQATVYSLVGHLKAKGVLTEGEVAHVFDQALVLLEEHGDDTSLRVARVLVESMASTVARIPAAP